MGISVKSRCRVESKEDEYLRIPKADLEKAALVCAQFHWIPYYAIVIDAGNLLRAYIMSKQHLVRVCPPTPSGIAWKMTPAHVSQYDKDPHIMRRATYEQGVRVNSEVASAFATDEGYTRMPGWHTSNMLGNAIIESFNLDVDYYKGENLFYIVSEGLCAVSIHISEMLKAINQDPKANWNEHALPRLNELYDFVVAVLLGTNSVSHPGKSLKDFSWMPVS